MTAKTIKRLEELLSKADNRIEQLETEAENREYKENWRWRHFRDISEEDNLGLPVPRLEVNYRKLDAYNTAIDMGLVRHKFPNRGYEFIPFESTRVGGGISGSSYEDNLEEPFRQSAHFRDAMIYLGLRGFVVGKGKFKEVDLSDTPRLPGGLQGNTVRRFSKEDVRKALDAVLVRVSLRYPWSSEDTIRMAFNVLESGEK